MAYLAMNNQGGGTSVKVESLSWIYYPSHYNWLNFLRADIISESILQGASSPSACNGHSGFFTCSHASNYTETFTFLKKCKVTYLHKLPSGSYGTPTTVTQTQGSTLVISPLADAEQLLFMRFEEI